MNWNIVLGLIGTAIIGVSIAVPLVLFWWKRRMKKLENEYSTGTEEHQNGGREQPNVNLAGTGYDGIVDVDRTDNPNNN